MPAHSRFSNEGPLDGSRPNGDPTKRDCLVTIFQNVAQVSLPLKHCDDLEGIRLRPVNNGVVGISNQSPETQASGCEVGPGMATQGPFGKKCAGIVNRLFYTISGTFAVGGDETPNIKDVGFRQRRKRVAAHLPAGALLSPGILHGLYFLADLRPFDEPSALGLQITFLDMSRKG